MRFTRSLLIVPAIMFGSFTFGQTKSPKPANFNTQTKANTLPSPTVERFNTPYHHLFDIKDKEPVTVLTEMLAEVPLEIPANFN